MWRSSASGHKKEPIQRHDDPMFSLLEMLIWAFVAGFLAFLVGVLVWHLASPSRRNTACQKTK